MTTTEYRNFDLLITRAGDGYKAIVVDAPAGEASVLFDLPSASAELAGLGGLVRGLRRNIGVADEPDSQPAPSLTGLGSRLFEAIFGDKVGALLAASQASVSQEGAGLRLRLRFEEDAAGLALLPWETLYDPGQGHFVGLGEASPILRYLSLPRSRSALPVKPPLRVLALLSSPAQLPSLDVEREWQAIQDALAALVGDGKFVLERLPSPTLDALQQRLLGEPVHILHFIGHGVFDEAAQAGCLALEDGRGRSHLVQGGDLAKLLRNHPAVRLAYLNACEGALASGQSVFTGVAQALVREGVPAAVAMQAEISDPGAIELARVFYTALAAGRPVDAALTQARVALSASGSPEWAIPVLFSRSPDNRLFDIRQVLPTPDCPYPGMVPFNEAQKDLFFGREREIEEAVERLRQHPFLAIVGPSGSGKSSLIYAGVIPALRRSRRFGAGEWAIRIMRPSDRRTAAGQAAPLQALAELLDLPSPSPSLPPSPLPTLPSPTLLFIDQFEEIFTLAGADERQAFLDTLQGLIGRPNLYILLTARADFYPDLMACTLWQPIRANRLELPPLGDDELWAAIVEPANRVGVTVDEALAVKLIADASGERGSLPLVQETLVLLWDKVAERQLRLKAYQEMAQDGRSGLQVAIDRRASLVYDNLPEAAQPLARRIFLRLVQFGEGRADTRRQQTVEELRASGDDPALFDETLVKLTASRLLTATGEAGERSRRIDIAHEALIAGWPRLQEWLGQRRLAEQTRRRLEGKAAEWVAAQQKGGLLDEYELQEAETWLAGEDAGELGYSQALTDLVRVSRDTIAQAAAEKEAQQRRELEQAQQLAEEQRLRAEAEQKRATDQAAAALRMQRRNRILMAVGAVAALAAILAGVLGIRAVEQQGRAEEQRQVALARQLAAQSQELLTSQSDWKLLYKASLLAVESLRRHPTIEGSLALGDAIQRLPDEITPVEYEDSLERLVLSPDGDWGVYGNGNGVAQAWEIATGKKLAQVIHKGSLRALAVSPDSKWVASASADGEIRIWDPRTGIIRTRMVRSLSISNDILYRTNEMQLVFGPQCLESSSATSNQCEKWLLASGGIQGEPIQIWDAQSGEEIARSPHVDAMELWGFSPDGRWLALCCNGSAFLLWEPLTGKEVPLPYLGKNSHSLVFTPDNRWTVIVKDDEIVLAETTSGQEQVRRGRLVEGGASILAIGPTCNDPGYYGSPSECRTWNVVTAEFDDAARVRTIPSFREAAHMAYGSDSINYINHVTFSPDGAWVVSSDLTGDIRIWRANSGREIARIDLGTSVDFLEMRAACSDLSGWMPGGRCRKYLVAAGGLDSPIYVYQFSGGQEILRMNVESPYSIELGPRCGLTLGIPDELCDRWFLARDRNGIRVWDIDTGRLIGLMASNSTHDEKLLQVNCDIVSSAQIASCKGWLASTGGWDVMQSHETTNSEISSPVKLNEGNTLEISADQEQVVRLLRKSVGREIKLPHQAPVGAVTVSVDGKWLATAENCHTPSPFELCPGLIHIWDMESGREVARMAHEKGVTAVSFSSDARWIASSSDDDTVRVWLWQPNDLVELACSRLDQNLTQAEWRQYLPDEPYRPTCTNLPLGE